MNRTEIWTQNLAVQKKKLADLKAWKSVKILTQTQAATVSAIEKQLAQLQNNENSIILPAYELETDLEFMDSL